MDPQYVPALLGDDKIAATQRMVSLIGDAAATANVNVFRRFALMKHWNANDNVPFEDMVDPADNTRLHQSERSTAQIARALTSVISDAAFSLDVQSPAPGRMPAKLPTTGMGCVCSSKLRLLRSKHSALSAPPAENRRTPHREPIAPSVQCAIGTGSGTSPSVNYRLTS